MTVKLSFGKDQQGFNAFAPYTAGDKWSVTLAPTDNTSIVVPSNYDNWIAFISVQPGGTAWFDFTGQTATVPSGGTLAASTAELNPGQRRVSAGDTISCVSNSSTDIDIGISLYAITD